MVILLIYGWGGKLSERVKSSMMRKYFLLFWHSSSLRTQQNWKMMEMVKKSSNEQMKESTKGQRRKHRDFTTESEDYSAYTMMKGRRRMDGSWSQSTLFPSLSNIAAAEVARTRFASAQISLCKNFIFQLHNIVSFIFIFLCSITCHIHARFVDYPMWKSRYCILRFSSLTWLWLFMGKKEGRRALSTMREVSISTRIP